MRPLLRRFLRVLTLTAAVLLLLFGLAAFVITQPTFGSAPAWAGPQADPGRLRRHVEFLTTEASPRDSDHPENLAKAADYIRSHFERTGARVRDQPFEVRGQTYRNVVASFGPETGPLLVVGAHYDSFGDFGPNPGADDNASGTAGLLELARLLDGRPLAHRIELVAYANEEPPYFGSPWMGSAVHARSLKGQEVRGMICLEMIGYFTDEQPWPHWLLGLLYPDRGDFIAIAGRWSDRTLARHLKKSIRASGFPTYSFTAPRSAGLDGSDQINYWDLGIPAVMVTDTSFVRNPNYHTPGDTAGTLDYGRMAGVVEGIFVLLFSSSPELKPRDRHFRH
ncbi:MAG TPA: M28 family peptidase [Thermoanaerobaculia bacterium]